MRLQVSSTPRLTACAPLDEILGGFRLLDAYRAKRRRTIFNLLKWPSEDVQKFIFSFQCQSSTYGTQLTEHTGIGFAELITLMSEIHILLYKKVV